MPGFPQAFISPVPAKPKVGGLSNAVGSESQGAVSWGNPRSLYAPPCHRSFCLLPPAFFNEDWKQHLGWGNLAYQQAEDGARRGLLLSLLLDHSLFFYAEQTVRIKHKLPALTVGSLRSAIQNDSLISVVSEVVNDEQPVEALDRLKIQLKEFQIRNHSTKHLSGRTMPKFTPKIKNVLHSEKMVA